MLLMTNVDNITGDQIPFIIEKLFEHGAKNVHVIPAFTKKGRQEHIFLIDVPEYKFKTVANFMVAETGTLGIRSIKTEHHFFEYDIEKVKLTIRNKEEKILWNGTVDVKIIKDGEGNFLAPRAEYEQIKRIVEEINRQEGFTVTFYEIKESIENSVISKIRSKQNGIKLEIS